MTDTTDAQHWLARAQAGDLDLLEGEFYTTDPYPTYAWLRENAPVYWDPHNEIFGITRYDDIQAIEKNPRLWTSQVGFRPLMDRAPNPAGYEGPRDPSMIGRDDPAHQQQRSLVARRFTPKAVSQVEDDVRAKVTSILDAVIDDGRAEVVNQIAAPLPAMMIGDLLGFPHELWPKLREWSERTIVLGGGPRYASQDGLEAVFEFHAAAQQLLEDRRECPLDDVMSVWVTAEIDGCPLSDALIQAESLLLLDGGAETTRTVIAHSIVNFIRHPEQWQKLVDDPSLIPVAVEECIRYVTPIYNMCRHATADTELHGVPIREGQQVVLMYSSANRDPEHFENPEAFDVARHPNHHIAFGFGTHFCLGASLARLEIRVMFEELVRRITNMRLVQEPVLVPGAFVYGMESAVIEFDART